MSAKDLSTAWDQAVQRALETAPDSLAAQDQISQAASLHVRTGVFAGNGSHWGMTYGYWMC